MGSTVSTTNNNNLPTNTNSTFNTAIHSSESTDPNSTSTTSINSSDTTSINSSDATDPNSTSTTSINSSDTTSINSLDSTDPNNTSTTSIHSSDSTDPNSTSTTSINSSESSDANSTSITLSTTSSINSTDANSTSTASSINPLESAVTNAQNTSDDFKSWQAAVSYTLADKNLMDDISESFVNHLKSTIFTDDKKKIKSSVLSNAKGVLSDEMYRIIYNQLNDIKKNWSEELRRAIKTVRPGASAISHQTRDGNKYCHQEICLNENGGELTKILYRNDKVVICKSMVDGAVTGFHEEKGHLNPTAFCSQFKHQFYCLINEQELKQKYQALQCDGCKKKANLKAAVHKEFIFVREKRNVISIDFMDVTTGQPRE
eukprot:283410_1